MIGDRVLLYSERVPGVVEFIVESEEDLEEWGLDEPIVIFRTERYGLMGESQNSIENEGIELISRHT